MTLTPWLLRVKQARGELLRSVLVGVLVAAGVLALHAHDDERAADTQALGSSLSAGLARLAVEPVASRDRIALGVLSNRLSDLERVAGVTVYTVDDTMLAIAGNPQHGRPVIEPIVQDSQIIGYARVSMLDVADTTASNAALLTLLLALLTGPLLVGLIRLAWPPAAGQRPETRTSSATVVAVELKPKPRHLLVVNLFNQLSLKPEVREQELTHAHQVASGVADLYTAHVLPLRGTGLVLEFSGGEDAERPFQVVCAAFLLAKLLAAEHNHGHYRLGAHVAALRDDEQLETICAEVRDAALLSAVAKSATVVISDAVFQRIARPERLHAEAMTNPLLQELESTDAAAWLVSALEAPYERLIEQQARELGYSGESTASESTF